MSFSLIPFTANGGTVLPPRNVMSVGQFLQSPNQRFRLIFQEDNRCVLYDGGSPVWVADASSAYAGQIFYKWKAVDQPSVSMNYQFVVQDFKNQRIWQTQNTDVLGGDKYQANAAVRTHLQLQDDGNLVVIQANPIFTSNAAILSAPEQAAILIPAGTDLVVDKRYVVGGTTMVFQSDGNFVVSNGPLGVLWATWTQNKGATRAVMQGDGNFVIYDASMKPLWNSGTAGHPEAYLRLQANGSFSVISDRVCWARFGFTPTIRGRKIYYPDNSSPEHNGTAPYPTYGHIGWEF